jgi:elongation factor G
MLLFTAGLINRLGKIEEGTTAWTTSLRKSSAAFHPARLRPLQVVQEPPISSSTPLGDSNFNGDLSYQLAAADGVVFVNRRRGRREAP